MVVKKMMTTTASDQALQPVLNVVEGWHRRPAHISGEGKTNALTIDVEDYFQVEAFFKVIDRSSWHTFECRVERNVDLILELLSKSKSTATFFTLGWIAQRYPSMVRNIVSQGHELASHGSDHQRADAQGRAEFLLDIIKSKRTLEDLTGIEVKGYRAPSFSILKDNLWALDQIAFAGYRYSSSIYPVVHDNYGIPEAPRFAFHPFPGEEFMEIPITSIRVGSRNLPCGGGGYFRLLPYAVNAAALRRVNRRERKPCVFYFHPWELDVHQPRISGASTKSKFRHYLNLARMQPRLRSLLKEFQWRSMEEIFLPRKTLALS
jgi:polysaccharide deacetylase family protein (PEP-CTERM system associated)